MPVFFGGQLLISPTTRSVVDDSALYNKNLTVGNVAAFIGPSIGGAPNTILTFGNPTDAQSALIGGELLTAVLKAFAPSTETGSPQSVVAIRVNPAVQSSLAVVNGTSLPLFTLQSTDYGAYTNQIKVKIETGTSQGYKLTTQFGNNYYSGDNVYRNAISIQYTGAQATSRMQLNGQSTGMTLEAPNATVVATVDFTVYQTIQQVVDYINTLTDFTASVIDGNGQRASLNALDTVTNQDIKTAAYTMTANLQAIVDWYNSAGEGYVTATRSTANNTGKVPTGFTAPWTFLSGGSDGTITNTQWSNAFATLQSADVQWFTPISSSASIWAMGDAHAQFMSTQGRRERRQIAGMALGSSDSAAIAAAKNLNSDRTSLVHIGYYDYDTNGRLTLLAPYQTAAAIAGAFSGVSPGTPMTNKSLAVRGLERALRNPTDTDPLILAGVLCVAPTLTGYKVVKSISTWLNNTNYNRVEQSVGAALDFVARNVRQALAPLVGQKANQITLSLAVSKTESTLKLLAQPDPAGPGVLVGDADSPPFTGITAALDGDVINVQFQCSPVLPANYVLVTIYAVPFSGTATA